MHLNILVDILACFAAAAAAAGSSLQELDLARMLPKPIWSKICSQN